MICRGVSEVASRRFRAAASRHVMSYLRTDVSSRRNLRFHTAPLVELPFQANHRATTAPRPPRLRMESSSFSTTRTLGTSAAEDESLVDETVYHALADQYLDELIDVLAMVEEGVDESDTELSQGVLRLELPAGIW